MLRDDTSKKEEIKFSTDIDIEFRVQDFERVYNFLQENIFLCEKKCMFPDPKNTLEAALQRSFYEKVL